MSASLALVTGATRGIGRAVAESLAAAGVRVAVHGRADLAAAQAAADALPGGPHAAVVADLADPDAAVALVAGAVDALGGLSLLVNNAGIYEPLPPLEAAPAEFRMHWDRHLDVNLTSAALLCQAALPALRHSGGRIVNVTSRGAFRGEPNCLAYGAAKAGLNSFTQSLAVASASAGVSCFVVAPGWVDTDMTTEYLARPEGEEVRSQSPLGRVASPQEVAAAVKFCALDAPMSMTGAILDVNGASYLRS